MKKFAFFIVFIILMLPLFSSAFAVDNQANDKLNLSNNNTSFKSPINAPKAQVLDSVPNFNFLSMNQNTNGDLKINGNNSPYSNQQITDGVTQLSAHTIGIGPAKAAVNAYLRQAQSQSILFANMVNQQQQYATIASTTLTKELNQLYSPGNSQ